MQVWCIVDIPKLESSVFNLSLSFMLRSSSIILMALWGYVSVLHNPSASALKELREGNFMKFP